MKKILSLILSAGCGTILLAQPAVHSFSFTPKVGLTLNELIGEPMIVECEYTAKYKYTNTDPTLVNSNSEMESIGKSLPSERKTGWMVGLDCQYQVSKPVGLVFGVNYAHLNSGVEMKESYSSTLSFDELSVSYHYIQIPILTKVYLYKGFAVQAGLQLDIATKGKSHIDGNYKGTSLSSKINTITDTQFACTKIRVFLPDDPKTFVLSIPVGVSYEYKQVIASASYSIPCTHSYDDNVHYNENKLYNSAFQFSLGYRFELK